MTKKSLSFPRRRETILDVARLNYTQIAGFIFNRNDKDFFVMYRGRCLIKQKKAANYAAS